MKEKMLTKLERDRAVGQVNQYHLFVNKVLLRVF